MNVYNEAHNLASAIKDCEEFKTYNELKQKLAEKPELDNAVKDFMNKQFELQMKQMQGQEIGQDEQENIGRLYGIIISDPLAADYMQAEMRFSLMMNDVYKILGDAIGMPLVQEE